MKLSKNQSSESQSQGLCSEEAEQMYRKLTDDNAAQAMEVLLEISEEELADNYQPGKTESL